VFLAEVRPSANALGSHVLLLLKFMVRSGVLASARERVSTTLPVLPSPGGFFGVLLERTETALGCYESRRRDMLVVRVLPSTPSSLSPINLPLRFAHVLTGKSRFAWVLTLGRS
jgi:hypothetical protein